MITILRWFLYVIISVDRFDIITPQGIGKGIKKEKILFGLVFIACACINPGIEFTTLAWKETFTTHAYYIINDGRRKINIIFDTTCERFLFASYTFLPSLSLECFMKIETIAGNFNFYANNFLLLTVKNKRK